MCFVCMYVSHVFRKWWGFFLLVLCVCMFCWITSMSFKLFFKFYFQQSVEGLKLVILKARWINELLNVSNRGLSLCISDWQWLRVVKLCLILMLIRAFFSVFLELSVRGPREERLMERKSTLLGSPIPWKNIRFFPILFVVVHIHYNYKKNITECSI